MCCPSSNYILPLVWCPVVHCFGAKVQTCRDYLDKRLAHLLLKSLNSRGRPDTLHTYSAKYPYVVPLLLACWAYIGLWPKSQKDQDRQLFVPSRDVCPSYAIGFIGLLKSGPGELFFEALGTGAVWSQETF